MARTLRGTALLLALSVVVGGALPAATAGPVAAAALASPVASASVATAKATIKKKTTTNLNLRQKPTASSKSLLVIPTGVTLTVLKKSGTWEQVKYASKTGWVSGKYLTSTSAPKAAVYRYAQSYQELRASASAKSKSLGAVTRKTKVQYLGASGSWSKVKVSGKTGFVPSNQLGVKAPAASYRWLTSKQTGYKSASTKSSKVVSLAAGTKVEWLRSSGSWSQVSTAKGPVWVASKQLSTSAPKPPAKPTPQAPKVIGQRWFVDPTAVRKSASTTAGSLGTIPAGQKVDLLQSKGSWSQVKTSKGTGWVPTSSLITTAYTPVSGQYRWTTTNLNLRSGAGTMYKSVGVLPTGERLTVKGTSAGWSRVQTSKGIGWVSSSYLSSKAPAATAPTQQPAPPKPQAPRPEAIQYRWTTANLNLRTGAGTSYPSKAVVPQAEKVTYLKADTGWAYISSTKGTGWVSERYLSTSGPATVQPDTRAVMKAVQQRFAGYYTSMGTLRSGSVGHSSGRAVDIMIRNYKDPQSIAAGNRIAQFLLDNRMELGVEYLIWRDKIWLPTTGWTEYSKSGKYGTQFTGNWNDTTLHNDHVHVETYGNAATGGKLDDSAVR
ncbi:Hypothetical protein GcLGCM259_2393 [Glutamicibacter creatinolyticus]|uniref:SH3b domain-containing protein n=1 Tax=Glutamicibacter creatinolyticus TaxID=162496 RepID=A0A5B7WXU5_9MICC|nr:SH3 domain-containing protein [Glutamicibacter creatinolyticus]QCY48100.1 Hypothetical protein GcLGCM259_2393 [Glutamicibacter creatinolyticus]